MPQTLSPKLKIRLKADYSARAGGIIAGRLVRGSDGKFSSGGSDTAPNATDVKPTKPPTPLATLPGKGKGGKGGGKGKGGAKKPKLTPEQQAKNLGDIASKHLGDDLAEALTVGDTPGDISGVKPEYGDQLVKKGLAVKHSDGSYELSGSGKSYVKAAQSGDEKKAGQVLKHATAVTGDKTARQQAQASARQERQQQANQRRQLADRQRQERQNLKKKEFAGLRIHFKASNPKVHAVMGEFKRGTLHSGSAKGPKVSNRKQAIAIALSQAGLSKKELHTGAMLAFMLPTEAANQLAQSMPDCDPDGMHLTLCYLGQIAELPYRLEDLVLAIAEYVTCQPPIFGEISGTGRFSNVDEGDGVSAFYASFDAPNLPGFRQGLVDCLENCGIPYQANHGYTPHITLSYLESAAPTPNVQIPPLKFKFDSLTLAWGDEQIAIPLGEMTKDVAGGMAGYGHGPGGAFTPGSLGGASSGGSGHSSSVMNAAQMPKTGDMVSWQTSGGKGRGKIVSLHKASTVRKTPVKTIGTEDEPAARIEIYSPDEMGEWQPTGTHIAHAVSSLTKLVFHNSSTKEVGKLSVYKDANGAWRWLTFSSSGYLDRDGEIVPTDELSADCERADREGDYGPLLWWHEKSLKLGECDFNAMCGRILVESGPFDDPEVGEAFSEIEEALGTSIGFGYQTKAGGVYKGIRKFERSLLPDVVASNTLTRVFINGDTNMATIQKDKKGILERFLGKDKVAQIESQATAAEKQAQLAGLAYKAAKPPGPTFPPKPKAAAAKPPTDATPPPADDQEPVDEEDMLDGGADEAAEDEEGMDENAPEEGSEGEEYEGSEGDNVFDMTMESLHGALDSMIQEVINNALTPIKEMLHTQGETATKEVDALAVAYKEVTGILIAALKENSEALKLVMNANQDATKRIAQLERKVSGLSGELPRVAKQTVTRASASPSTIVGKEATKEALDPDMHAINSLAERLVGGGNGLFS